MQGPGEGQPTRLMRWLALSLLLHAVAFVSWHGVRQWALARPDAVPQWVREAVLPAPPKPNDPLVARPPTPQEEQAVEIPLQFLEVDPSLVTDQEPPKTPYYSTANTLAGNPNPPVANATQPRIEGRRPDRPATMDVQRPSPEMPVPAQPVAPTQTVQAKEATPEKPQAKPADVAKAAEKPREERPKPEEAKEGGLKPGDMQLAKANPKAVSPTPQPQPQRKAQPEQRAQAAQEETAPPRKAIKRLAQAREQKGVVVTEKMQQEGGVKRFSVEASLDVRSSPFASYDRQLIYAVQQRWYALLEEHKYALDRYGRVVLKFQLRSDGMVADMTQVSSDVGDLWALLCESAVMSQAPYAPWPEAMRRLVGKETREITFTFHYDN